MSDDAREGGGAAMSWLKFFKRLRREEPQVVGPQVVGPQVVGWYSFEPKPDITAFELVLLLQRKGAGQGLAVLWLPGEEIPAYEEPSEPVARHFRRIDKV